MREPDWKAVLEFAAKKPGEAANIIRREGLALENLDDLWQKLAFTLYSMLVEVGVKTEAILEEIREESG